MMKKFLLLVFACCCFVIGKAQLLEDVANIIVQKEMAKMPPVPKVENGVSIAQRDNWFSQMMKEQAKANKHFREKLNKQFAGMRELAEKRKRKDSISQEKPIYSDWFGISKTSDSFEVYEYFRITKDGDGYVVRSKRNALDKAKGSTTPLRKFECEVLYSNKDSLCFNINRGYNYKGDVRFAKLKIEKAAYTHHVDICTVVFSDSTLQCSSSALYVSYDDYGRVLWEKMEEPEHFTCRKVEEVLGMNIEKW